MSNDDKFVNKNGRGEDIYTNGYEYYKMDLSGQKILTDSSGKTQQERSQWEEYHQAQNQQNRPSSDQVAAYMAKKYPIMSLIFSLLVSIFMYFLFQPIINFFTFNLVNMVYRFSFVFIILAGIPAFKLIKSNKNKIINRINDKGKINVEIYSDDKRVMLANNLIFILGVMALFGAIPIVEKIPYIGIELVGDKYSASSVLIIIRSLFLGTYLLISLKEKKPATPRQWYRFLNGNYIDKEDEFHFI